MTVDHFLERSDPIRRQLLGASPSGGFWIYVAQNPEDVPLKAWIEAHLGEQAVAA